MGYRHYMYIVPRNVVDAIKHLTYAELETYAREHGYTEKDDEGTWVNLHRIVGDEKFFEFGKYYENADNIEALGEPLFANEETQKEFEDYRPYVVGRDAVLCAIEDYRKKIIKWYADLLMTQEQYDESHDPWERRIKQEERIKRHLENQKDEWENSFGIVAINTNMESKKIVRSWLYEYEIFELVHQMKIMDWEKNALVFYGW